MFGICHPSVYVYIYICMYTYAASVSAARSCRSPYKVRRTLHEGITGQRRNQKSFKPDVQANCETSNVQSSQAAGNAAADLPAAGQGFSLGSFGLKGQGFRCDSLGHEGIGMGFSTTLIAMNFDVPVAGFLCPVPLVLISTC